MQDDVPPPVWRTQKVGKFVVHHCSTGLILMPVRVLLLVVVVLLLLQTLLLTAPVFIATCTMEP